ncbi:rhodanese-like domain-containing protein [Vibrio sp. RC27]
MQEYTEFFQQNTILCVAWIAIFGAVIFTVYKSSTAKFKYVDVNELTQKVNKENGIVVDIRNKDEFSKGHITDSINVLPSEITSGNLGTLENHKADPIIVVCQNGHISPASANQLASAGFEQVSVLNLGIGAWKDGKLPLIRGKK